MKKSLNSIMINKSNNINTESENTYSNTLSEINKSNIDIKNIKSDELIYPCKDIILHTKLLLHPYQMNNDLYLNLKKNLIDKVEKKCMKDGYIIKVYKILEYKNGYIDPENFTGAAVYNIKYLAKVCFALKDSIIICKISSYLSSANFILADFGPGPILKIIFTKSKDINLNNFTINNDKSIIHNKTKTILDVNLYVKIQIKTIRFYQNDIVISCIGFLVDLATQEEIKEYAYKNEDKIIEIDKNINQNILFNEEYIDEENL